MSHMCRCVAVAGLLGLATAGSFSAAYAQDINYAGHDAAVGEVRTSLLSLADFQYLYGPDWTLLDGQNVASKPIAPFLAPEQRTAEGVFLPDARGRFLRMVNHDAAANVGDPSGNRPIGGYQSDAVGKHTHAHDIPRARDGSGRHRRGSTGGNNRFDALRTDEVAKDTTEASPGPESRPRNIAVNFYVRVACTTGGRC